MFRILRGQEREYPIGYCRLGHDLITRIVPERFAVSYQRFAQSCSSTPNLTNRPMKALDLSQQGRDIVSNRRSFVLSVGALIDIGYSTWRFPSLGGKLPFGFASKNFYSSLRTPCVHGLEE